ncbi:unnamed protein product [Alopecurus aequalis]
MQITKRKPLSIEREEATLVMSSTFKFLLVLVVLAGIVRADAADGPHSCGGVDIPYPFGIGNGNYRQGFEVVCEAGKPVLPSDTAGGSFRIGNFSTQTDEAQVWLPIEWACYNEAGEINAYNATHLTLNESSAFRFSNTKNDLFVLGCFTLGVLRSKLNGDKTMYTQYTGCLAFCADLESAENGTCSGAGCCRADIPHGLVGSDMAFVSDFNHSYVLDFNPCSYAFMAEKGQYTFDVADLNMDLSQTARLMPVMLDWAIRDNNLTCDEAQKKKDGYACISSHSTCNNSITGPGYTCNCTAGYEGNPYIADGCTDINECEHPDRYSCKGKCVTKQGYYDCICPKYSKSPDAKTIACNESFPRQWRIATGVFVFLFIAAIMVFVFLLIRQKRKMHQYYQKNGGPTLEKLSTLKLYKKEDIRKIQKSSNVIGQGGFGKVYKGCIGDETRVVAVKETISVSSEHNDQFANEISIQSQVIHKNIVKLVGCCLEVDSPILVYEFVPKGSLDVILHGDKSIPLSLGQRLQIAAESAEGLAYMHSKANVTILHGDVKPANILINDDYTPKISDFGISRLMATDKEHTALIIGDRSYMDPVYFQTGLLTNKSDVYSFGVLLLELITRKKASHSNQNELLRQFSESYEKEKSMIGLVDKELSEADPQLLNNLAEMIHECLSLDVNERPDMMNLEARLRDMVKRCQITE